MLTKHAYVLHFSLNVNTGHKLGDERYLQKKYFQKQSIDRVNNKKIC